VGAVKGRWRLDLAYDGSGFAGWQVQPERRTVQGELERVLGDLGERGARPVGAGRTDAGVHALGAVAHVDLDRAWAPSELEHALRSRLPEDLDLAAAAPAAAAFHARFDAQTRTYHYALGLTHNAFFRRRRWVRPDLPPPAWMDAALGRLVGERDLSALAKAGGDTKSARARIETAWWRPYPGGAVLGVTADRFLYGMVRALVGTLHRAFALGDGPDHLDRVLAARDRAAAGAAAPPDGLYLAGVSYRGDPPVIDRMNEVALLAGLIAAEPHA
jgi:tRNA pseudouridine38-40 synthase